MIARFASFRVTAQVVAFVTGVVVVRLLPPEQYALYVIATTLLAAVTVVSASGITSTLLAKAAQEPRPSELVGQIYSAANKVRKQTAILITACVIPLLCVLLLGNGADVQTTILMCVILAGATFPTLAYGVALVELQIQRRYGLIGLIDTSANGVRLMFTAACAALAWVAAPVLFIGSLLMTAAQGIIGVYAARQSARPTPNPPSGLVREFRRAFARAAPATIAMVLGEQAVTLILTIVGNTIGIAQIGALGRFAVGFALINSVLTIMGASYLARLSGGREALRTGALKYTLTYLLVSASLTLTLILASPLLLSILGSEYRHLTAEFAILMTGALVTNFALFGIGAVNHARGWLRFGWTYIPAAAAWFAFCTLFIDLRTSEGAAIMAASLSLPVLASNIIRAIAGYRGTPH